MVPDDSLMEPGSTQICHTMYLHDFALSILNDMKQPPVFTSHVSVLSRSILFQHPHFLQSSPFVTGCPTLSLSRANAAVVARPTGFSCPQTRMGTIVAFSVRSSPRASICQPGWIQNRTIVSFDSTRTCRKRRRDSGPLHRR